MTEIRKVELHTVRLDSDIWAALKAHPQSLNRILRDILFDDPAVAPKPRKQSSNFQCEHCPAELQSLSQLDEHLADVHGLMIKASARKVKSPLLKPSDRR